MSDWKPIDSAPKDGTEILVSDGFAVFTAMYIKSSSSYNAPFFATTVNGQAYNDGSYCKFKYEYLNVTHWMPLPAPPQQENDDE